MEDILIIGGGPAGASAALTARNRGRRVTVVSGLLEDIPLWKAAEVSNYPGLPKSSGREILECFHRQCLDAGAGWVTGRATSAYAAGESFGVAAGSDFYESRALILAVGMSQGKLYPGEAELLGRGVSYCATCDGMLYRDKDVAVIGLCKAAEEEAEFLRSIGCRVRYFDKRRPYRIEGGDKVEALAVDGTRYAVDGVFIFRSAVSAANLLPDLALDGEGHMVTERQTMAASVPGVWACGDCTGKPYQIAKAVGEGNVAALSACEALDRRDKEKAAR